MSNPNALYLLADHIKLSLLERQRSKALNLLQDDSGSRSSSSSSKNNSTDENEPETANGTDAQDGHIARSLEQFRNGIDGLEREQARLESEGEEGCVLYTVKLQQRSWM